MGREYASFGMELARASTTGRTLKGYASVFDYPIETLETWLYGTTTYIRHGAFKKTLQENGSDIQVLFNHGHDPVIGEKPLGVPSVMREDAHGLYVEVPLDPVSYNDDIVASLESGALRAMSIAFQAVREDQAADDMREIHEVRLFEFGPVTFPANAAAVAAVHSLSSHLPAELHWDGAAALRACHTAGDFRRVAFERANDSDPETAAHWALPHHPTPDGAPGNADRQGVGAAIGALNGGRGGPPDLKNEGAARSHLEAHQSEFESAAVGTATDAATTGEPAGSTSEAAADTDDRLEIERARGVLLREELRAEAERMVKWVPPRN